MDRELAQLQQRNIIRVFKLFAASGQDLCIVLTEDYEACVRALAPKGKVEEQEEIATMHAAAAIADAAMTKSNRSAASVAPIQPASTVSPAAAAASRPIKRKRPTSSASAAATNTTITRTNASASESLLSSPSPVKRVKVEHQQNSSAAATPPLQAPAVPSSAASASTAAAVTAIDDEDDVAINSETKSHHSRHDTAVLLSLFIQRFLPQCSDISVTRERLLSLIYTPTDCHSRFESLTADECISALVQYGLLVFRSASSFFLSVPGIARLNSAILAGRNDVLALVKRRQYKEVLLRELLALPNGRLKTSPARIEFHLREMIGSSAHIHLVDTTLGPLVKLVQSNR